MDGRVKGAQDFLIQESAVCVECETRSQRQVLLTIAVK